MIVFLSAIALYASPFVNGKVGYAGALTIRSTPGLLGPAKNNIIRTCTRVPGRSRLSNGF